MSVCPVCQDVLDMDTAAFQHHVNSHFEASVHTPVASNVEVEDRPDECPLCGYPLYDLGAKDVEVHTNACLDEQQQHPPSWDESIDEPLSWSATMPTTAAQDKAGNTADDGWDGPAEPGSWSCWVTQKPRKGDRWWDPLDTETDPSDIPVTSSPHAVSALRALLNDPAYPATHRSVLSKDATHIRHSFVYDVGWGCGYRNTLMVISALLLDSPVYRPVFSRERHGSDPGVRRTQGWIEEAWRQDFDPEGREHLGGKILGTRKWIGVSDIYAMFSYLGVESTLFDFPKPEQGPNSASRNLVNWVRTYFDQGVNKDVGSNRIAAQSNKLPVILQHQGHSRLVVGYEETVHGINLLVLDPGMKLPKTIRDLGLQHLSQSQSPLASSSSRRRKRSAQSSSHESLNFQRPFTTGASDPVIVAEPDSDSAFDLDDDEERTRGGWVRKKVSGAVERRKTASGSLPSTSKMLGYFRVNEARLAKFDEYQILAVSGGPLLSEQERVKRKHVRSVRVW